MRFQHQAFNHKPELGEYGDCHRTCLACLLDLDRDEVPNFGEFYGNSEAFFKAEEEFLYKQGLSSVNIAYSGDVSIDRILGVIGAANPDIYYIFAGKSKSGYNHSVIGCGGKLIWDVGQEQGESISIEGPCSDGYYWVEYFTTGKFVRNKD